MVFSSMIFIWAFLPIVFILDKIAGLPGGKDPRGGVLRKKYSSERSASGRKPAFLCLGPADYLWLLLVSIAANYLIGRLMGARGAALSARTARLVLLIAGIVLNLGILGYYKYFNFFANTLNRGAGQTAC